MVVDVRGQLWCSPEMLFVDVFRLRRGQTILTDLCSALTSSVMSVRMSHNVWIQQSSHVLVNAVQILTVYGVCTTGIYTVEGFCNITT